MRGCEGAGGGGGFIKEINMAINKMSYKGTYINNHQEFTCDYRSDIEDLPTQYTDNNRCVTGSTAFVIDDSSVWMLNSNGEWIEI